MHAPLRRRWIHVINFAILYQIGRAQRSPRGRNRWCHKCFCSVKNYTPWNLCLRQRPPPPVSYTFRRRWTPSLLLLPCTRCWREICWRQLNQVSCWDTHYHRSTNTFFSFFILCAPCISLKLMADWVRPNTWLSNTVVMSRVQDCFTCICFSSS